MSSGRWHEYLSARLRAFHIAACGTSSRAPNMSYSFCDVFNWCSSNYCTRCCHNYVIRHNYFMFTLLRFSRLFSVTSHVTTVTPKRSTCSRLAVDSRSRLRVDRTVDEIEVDFVANVYEALQRRWMTLKRKGNVFLHGDLICTYTLPAYISDILVDGLCIISVKT